MFKSVEEIKLYFSGVQRNMSDRTLMPFVEMAALRYIIPFVGEAFYRELETAHKSDGGGTPAQKLAIVPIQRALAYYTFLDALPILSLAMGDLGVHEVNTTNSTPARQWVYNNLESACAGNADIYLDQALSYLEKFAGEYPTYVASGEYLESKELFFSSADELSRYINMGGSRIAYQTLRVYIRRAEDIYIRPTTGQPLFDSLKSKAKDKSLTASEKLLMEKILKTLSQYSLYEALTESGVMLSGFQISSGRIRVINSNEVVKDRLSADAKGLQGLKQNTERLGTQYMAELRRFLDENAVSIPLYQESEFFKKADMQRSYQLPDNSNSQSFSV